MDATIGAISPWYGSKRMLAPRIVEQLGPHTCYWEPFCGSMAVLLEKPVASMETVNDLHGDLINLALTIRHRELGPALYRTLRRTWLCEGMFEQSRTIIDGVGIPAEHQPHLDRAYWFFIFSWLGRNGTIGSTGGVNFCARYTTGGGSATARWRSAINSIPSWRRRLENVTILSRCGIETCEKIGDQRGTVIYADPPYLVKHEAYVHDFEDDDHKRLADALRRFEHARVVVSYYDHPSLEELYPGWTRVDCTINKQSAQANKRGQNGKTKAPEVLLINGPAFGQAEPKLF